MPLAFIDEIHDGRDFDIGEDSRDYTRVWIARCTLKHDEGYVIQQAESLGVPQVGDPYHKDAKARCVGVRGSNSSGPFLWTITAGYSTDYKKRDNPLEDPVEITWDDQFKSVQSDKDAFGKAMANSAGDTYDSPLSVDTGVKVATLKFNLDGENPLPTWFFELPADPLLGRYSLNGSEDVIDGIVCPAESLRFERASAGPVKERNDIKYRECTCKIARTPREHGWLYVERIDEGFREKLIDSDDPDDPVAIREPIRNKDGSLPAKPVPLDGNGKALANPSADSIVLRRFQLHSQADFRVVPGVEAPD